MAPTPTDPFTAAIEALHDAHTRPRSVAITTTDLPAFAEALFGGPESARSHLQAAHRALARARHEMAIVWRRRSIVGDPGVAWTWGREFYRRERPRVLGRVARCRAEIARCEGRIRELQECS